MVKLGDIKVGLTEIAGVVMTEPPGRVAAVASDCGDAVYYKPSKMVYLRCQDGWLMVSRFTLPTKNTMQASQFANACNGHLLDEKRIRFSSISPAPTPNLATV